MTNLTIDPGPLRGIVHVPSSKSYANRILILGSLKKTPFTICHLPEATDVTWLLSALKKIGLEIEITDCQATILNSFPECELEGSTIEVGEGGTTARFLASLLLLGEREYTLALGGRLKNRPWTEFIDFVQKFGGKAKLDGSLLRLQGPIHLPEVVNIDCSRTTQFASAIDLAFHNRTRVNPVNLNSSQSYWEMTKHLIELSKKTDEFVVPMDWSSASYPLVFAFVNQEVFFPQLSFDIFQSDAKILDLLKSFGVVEEGKDGIGVIPFKHHREIHMDVSDCLDLVPSLAYMLAHVKGIHKLTGIKNLIHKESDRLREVIALLDRFERKAWSDGEILHIQGSDHRCSTPQDLLMVDDHRMVMTAALFLKTHCGGSLGPIEAVEKSYPNFFNIFDLTGSHAGTEFL